jgi:predicted amidophosphoribosyltransferase
LLDHLLDLFWPRVCPVCDLETVEEAIHPYCLARLPRADVMEGATVFACFEDGPAWFRILHRWKYGGERSLVGPVAAGMISLAGDIPDDAVLVPLPDDPRRRLERGFSPVLDLTRELARTTGRECDPRLLCRARATPSQTSCADDAERRDNIRGAFRAGDLARWPRFRSLVLVEDQVTSGATVEEARSILALRGAEVRVWCAARAARAPAHLDATTGRH